MPTVKNVGEPCAGEPHARFDGGREETRPVDSTRAAEAPPVYPTTLLGECNDCEPECALQRVVSRAFAFRLTRVPGMRRESGEERDPSRSAGRDLPSLSRGPQGIWRTPDSVCPERVVSRTARWWLLRWPSRTAPTIGSPCCDSSGGQSEEGPSCLARA